jgi:peptide/nickel transport system ATP-binding protein
MDICRRENPALTMLGPGHRVACFAASPEVRPTASESAAPALVPALETRQ